MNFSLRIDTAFAKTFSVLRDIRYQASSQVLAHGLRSSIPLIRSASLQSLLDRGTEVDYVAILQCIDRSSSAELERIRPHASRMCEVIDQGLASSDPETRQRALWTIAKMEVKTHFHVLIDVVCNSDDPLQLVGIELTSYLVKAMSGRRHTYDSDKDSARLALMAELSRGLDNFPQHRIQSLFDWWVAVAHQDDDIVFTMIRDGAASDVSQRVLQYLERSKSRECLELVALFLWNSNANPHLVSVAAERKDPAFVEQLHLLCRRLGLTKEITRNITLSGVKFKFLNEETFLDPHISPAAKISLLELMTLQSISSGEIAPRIGWLLRNIDTSLEDNLAALIEHQRPMNVDIAVIALSDTLDGPDIESSVPAPWKQSMRDALEGFIKAHDRFGNRLRTAISYFFRDFKCEKLLEKLLEWPVGHLAAYARLSRLADSRYLDTLILELGSASPLRRQRGIRAAKLYGMDRTVEAIIVQKLEDPVDEVRIEAILALADANDREQAIILLSPLEVDSNPDVHKAAERSLIKLRGDG